VEKARQLSEILIKNALRLDIRLRTVQTVSGSGAVEPTKKWAWGPNVGYVDFAPDGQAIRVDKDVLQGYAWALSSGWINLAPTLAGVTNTCDGNLTGKAWAQHFGYVDFDDARIDGNGYVQGRATTTSRGNILFQGDHFGLKTSWKPTCAG
jgi:hypothetical protein